MDRVLTKSDKHAAASEEAAGENHLLNCVQDCLAEQKTGKVTGIGGVFLKSKEGDGKNLSDWYEKNLGMHVDERIGVAILRWENDKAGDGGATAWGAFPKDSDLFNPSKSDVMINYRVDDINLIYERLKKNDPKSILDEPKEYENGKFMDVIDPEGNKMQLWEPKAWDKKDK